jgi:hypothetical protein
MKRQVLDGEIGIMGGDLGSVSVGPHWGGFLPVRLCAKTFQKRRQETLGRSYMAPPLRTLEKHPPLSFNLIWRRGLESHFHTPSKILTRGVM